MLNLSIIESLKCLKDTDNSNELISFINSIPMIKNFYTERVNKFSKYLCEHRKLIERFVDDSSSQTELYKSEEERNIIKDIELILPYYKNGELVNVKTRTNLGDGKKTFSQSWPIMALSYIVTVTKTL